MQSTQSKNKEKKLRINDNKWCYTTTRAGARKKAKKHRNSGIRQHYRNELKEYMLDYM